MLDRERLMTAYPQTSATEYARIDAQPMPRLVPAAMAAASLVGLILIRRDLVSQIGAAGWLAAGLAAAALLAWAVCRWRRAVPLMVLSRVGISFPKVHTGWLRWRNIALIECGRRRHRLGDVTDFLLVTLNTPQRIDWLDRRRRNSIGDTPQTAVAIDFDLNWPMRAEIVRTTIKDWTGAFVGTQPLDPLLSPTVLPPPNRRADALVIAIAIALPLLAAGFDIGLPSARSVGLKMLTAGDATGAVPHLEAEARAGDASSAFALAMLYQNGDGVDRNLALAAGWFRRAALTGHGEAAYRLAEMTRIGAGVPKSTEDAIKWHQKAAGRGNADAAYVLGRIYRLGDGVRRDYPEAIKWLTDAAGKGHAPARHDLGRLYQSGFGVERDPAEARRQFVAAATTGYAPAIFDLALMDIEAGQTRAGVAGLTAAADRGYGPAQLRLAELLSEGRRMPPDPIEAFKWASLAERAMPSDAHAEIAAVKTRAAAGLNDETMQLAMQRLRAWRPAKN